MVAPAWGTTRREAPSHAPMSNFNPRTYAGCDITGTIFVWMIWDFNPCTRVGCDGTNPLLSPQASLFQSMHPRGVRPFLCMDTQHTDYFNPCTRVGCDSKLAQKPVSIYTSTIPLFTKPCQINLLYPPPFPFPRQYADIFWCEPPGKSLCTWGSHQSLYFSRLSTQTQKSGPADISSASRSSLNCDCWG